MALSSANAVSPAPVADNTARANASVAAPGNGNGGSFTDNLDSVLAQPDANDATASPKNDNDVHAHLHGHSKFAKLKSKLKGGEAGLMLLPPQLQQQQAIIQKLGATNTGIDIPALRAAMGKGAHIPGKMAGLPTLDPVTGKVNVGQAVNPSAAPETFAAAVNAAVGAPAAGTVDAAAQNSAPSTPTAPATPGSPAVKGTTQTADTANAANVDPSKAAAHAATQEKLVAALVKAAQAPVLKDGQTDGSKVPNAKIAHPARPQKAAATDSAPDMETIQALAAKIAATAGATHSADTAPAAAKGVAVAEVASRTTPAAPAVTKIESAAMANATQTATHTPAPEAKIEAQALPVQFDAASANQKGSDTNSKDRSGDKSQAQAGSARTAGDAPKQADAQAPNFPDAQPSASAPAHTGTTSANANLAPTANTQTTVPTTLPPQIAATLHVSPQPRQDVPVDQTAFAALGVAIAAKSKDGEKQFDINMHPADLGRVDVRISVDADGKTQAHLSAEHPQTLQMLQNDKATLERNLRDAGLNVANNGLSFSLKGEQQPSTPTFNARSRALSISAIQTADVSPTSSHASLAPGDSRLDIRV